MCDSYDCDGSRAEKQRIGQDRGLWGMIHTAPSVEYPLISITHPLIVSELCMICDRYESGSQCRLGVEALGKLIAEEDQWIHGKHRRMLWHGRNIL